MKFINYPLAKSIELPKIPKRRKKAVIKVEDIRDLIKEIETLTYPYNLKLKAAVLLAATSGMRSEEVYRLKPENIDIERRTIYIPGG
ncbi:tyrosine-type recombinase/integrase [Ferroglobus placidus]|uniref:tyrosine-type recombinase/integrase n=1 Tax=Ferroglobus placidus TaxID=54261 RepID=UPI0001B765C2|nr:hypothetical protein [Ferroglobus placidus]